MNDVTQLANHYIDAWNETDAPRRRALIARVFADDAGYVDPMMNGHGQPGIDAMIAGVQTQFPGYRFNRVGGVDAHGPNLRFSWELLADGKQVIVRGTDFGVLAADGRLQSVTGFIDQAAGQPAAA